MPLTDVCDMEVTNFVRMHFMVLMNVAFIALFVHRPLTLATLLAYVLQDISNVFCGAIKEATHGLMTKSDEKLPRPGIEPGTFRSSV